MTAQKKTIQLKYVRSKICTPIKHKLVIKGLGFTRLYQVIERDFPFRICGVPATIILTSSPCTCRCGSSGAAIKQGPVLIIRRSGRWSCSGRR